jgi:DNA-binding beta-propeller fold protein YncE
MRPLLLLTICAMLSAGCQGPQRPIFPAVEPPIFWPPAPDPPRIQYIGALHGEADLDIRLKGWDAVRATLVGRRQPIPFATPVAIAVHNDLVFVADLGLAVVHRLDLANRTYDMLRGGPDVPFQAPIDIAIDPQNRVLVADRARGVVHEFDLAGTWQRLHVSDQIEKPSALAADPTAGYWVADVATHACYHVTGPAEQRPIGERGIAPGQFNFPTGLTVDPNVGLVVADAMNFRVQRLAPDGTPITTFGQRGDAAGDFARPRDVAIDSDGHIYVVDNQFENVQIFNADGRLLLAFGTGGSDPGELSLPAGICIDTQDRIWIADSQNSRVQVFAYLQEAAP